MFIFVFSFLQQMTPLHMAAERGHVKIVEYLVCHGANINTKDHNGVIMCGYTNSSRLELQFKV